MILTNYVNTFGQAMLSKYRQRVHKVTINAEFTCPNRDGSIGLGGCTFCNNVSFNPNGRHPASLAEQIDAGRKVLRKRTGAQRYLAYFQAYTNTYADIKVLKQLYDAALSEPDVIGLCVGTRPDCVPPPVLDLLANYQEQGYEVWLELGLQSSFDKTLLRVNRGHDYATYCQAIKAAHHRHLSVCTHLIVGLPGEDASHSRISLLRVLEQGVEGLKLHPLHVVKGTQLANDWRRGEYHALTLSDYVHTVADLIALTPKNVIFHRLTATATEKMLLAPKWCAQKWAVLNRITQEMRQRQQYQGFKYREHMTWSPLEKISN